MSIPLSQRTEYEFRYIPDMNDPNRIREIVDSTQFFGRHEIDVAVELVEERLSKGVESGYEFVFLMKGNQTIGYSCYGEIPCTRQRYDLYWIAVDNLHRNQGLGRLILQETETRIRILGGVKIYIETGGRALYESTRAFYLRNGYEQVAKLDDFYSDGDAKLVFHKSLR